MCNNKWCRASIQLFVNRSPVGEINKSGCFRCPLLLMEKLIQKCGGCECNIPFEKSTDSSDRRTFSAPWDTAVYELYQNNLSTSKIILLDFYIDGATLSRSGTKSASFLRIRYSNIDQYSETWHTIGIAPTNKLIPSC